LSNSHNTEQWKKYWRLFPVKIINDIEEIEKHIFVDSPGCIIRDYRFNPILVPCSPTKKPTRIELFFSRCLYNEDLARKRQRSMHSLRVKNLDIMDDEFIRKGKHEGIKDGRFRRILLSAFAAWDRDLVLEILDGIEINPGCFSNKAEKRFCELVNLLLITNNASALHELFILNRLMTNDLKLKEDYPCIAWNQLHQSK